MSCVTRHAIRFRDEVEVRCDACGDWWPLTREFWWPNGRNVGGLILGRCRGCKNDHRKVREAVSRTDKQRAGERRYYARNRERILARNRERYAKRRDAEHLRAQLYYARHRRAA
jgi:hypothetical protein